MTAILALIRKDLILFLQDKRALILTVAMPVLLAAFFGYLTGGSGKKEAAKIEVGLVIQDDSAISKKIVAGLESESSLKVTQMDIAKAKELVRKGKLPVAFVLPAGFGASAAQALFGASAKPDLPIFYDPSQSTVLAMSKGMLTQYVMQSVSSDVFSGNGSSQVIENGIAQLSMIKEKNSENANLLNLLNSVKQYQEHQNAEHGAKNETLEKKSGMGLSTPFATKDEALTANDNVASNYNGFSHSFAGMIVQFVLFMAIDAGIGVLLQRKQGMWNRLLAAPVGMNTIIVARALSSALIAFGVTCFVFALAMLIFKVEILGSGVGFFGVAISFSLMTAAFGLLIAAFGRTPEAARGISIFATLIMVMLGGAWMPSFIFPQWLQDITVFIPTRWAVDGFDAMTWRGLGIDAALPAIAALLAFSALFGALAMWRFSAEQNRR